VTNFLLTLFIVGHGDESKSCDDHDKPYGRQVRVREWLSIRGVPRLCVGRSWVLSVVIVGGDWRVRKLLGAVIVLVFPAECGRGCRRKEIMR
jgi:hypothetical protein